MADVNLVRINKTFLGKIKAVDNLSLHVFDKEFLVLVGPSGCGKTTVLRIISGLEKEDSGEVFINGSLAAKQAKDRNIAMVFQTPALFNHLSVRQNIMLGCKIVDKAEAERQADIAAKMLEITDILDRRPVTLSGGQQRRVALARALVCKSDLFLFDEPLSNLDAQLAAEIRAQIIRLHEKLDSTFIYVTHDQTDAMTMGSRIAVMNNGSIQQLDTPQNVFNSPANIFVAGFIGTPKINLINAVVVKEKNQILAKANDFSVNISTRPNAINLVGKKVILGIRPGEFTIRSKQTSRTVALTVSLVEHLGAECNIYASVSDTSLVINSQNTMFKKGDVIFAEIKNVLLFDPVTEKNLDIVS